MGEVFGDGDFLFLGGEFLRRSGALGLANGGGDSVRTGGFEECVEFRFVQLGEVFVEELVEWDTLEEVFGVGVGSEGGWGGFGGGHRVSVGECNHAGADDYG